MRRVITDQERIRRSCGFGVVDLARATGYSHTLVSLVEAGQAKPSPKYRAAVAQALGVPERLIFGETLLEESASPASRAQGSRATATDEPD